MTVRENVLLAAADHAGERLPQTILRPGRVRRREREAAMRADELLALVRLDGHAEALASTLSGGQRKLLDFARAVMTGPRLLLLDEPMAGVNQTLREQLLEHMLELREREGVTFLLVEHDLELVMRVSDAVVVMNEGRVIASGLPETVRSDSRVVDAYLGTPP
jgi:ABC-type branched-subunit amino acid transport system ATPase component